MALNKMWKPGTSIINCPHAVKYLPLTATLLMTAIALCCAGCLPMPGAAPSPLQMSLPFFGPTSKPVAPNALSNTTPRQLQARLMGFADRYLNRMSEACDRVGAAASTPAAKASAHATKVYPSLTVVTLAGAENPEVSLRDLLVVVTLERMVWEGQWSRETFGEQATILTQAQRDMENDIWSVAASVMSQTQMQQMRALIESWRLQYPDRRYVSSMRFDQVAMMHEGEEEFAPVHQEFLAPLSEAARAVEHTRLLGERSLFLGSHMPVLLQWQIELLTDQIAARPEVQQMVTHSADFTKATQQFAGAVEKWPVNLSEQSESLRKLVVEIRGTLVESQSLSKQITEITVNGRSLAESLRQTAEVTDRMTARFASPSASGTSVQSRPFDVREYTQAIGEMTPVLKELNQVLASTDQLAGSPVWQQRLRDVEGITERRINAVSEKSTTLVEVIFVRSAWLVGLFCAAVLFTALVHRYVCHRIIGRNTSG